MADVGQESVLLDKFLGNICGRDGSKGGPENKRLVACERTFIAGDDLIEAAVDEVIILFCVGFNNNCVGLELLIIVLKSARVGVKLNLLVGDVWFWE